MKKGIYTIGSIPFDEWVEHNEAVEHLVMTGATDMQMFSALASAFDYTKFRQITLDGVRIEDHISQALEGESYSYSYESMLTSTMYSEDENCVFPLDKMYLNSNEGIGNFIVTDNDILTSDGKVLIHMPEQKELTIKEGIEEIGRFACCNYTETQKLTLCEGIKKIGDYAFAYTEGITDLVLPDTVITLGESSFCYVELEQLKLSANLQEIPDNCFSYSYLEDIEIPQSVKSIGAEAFARTFIHCVILPEGVETIGWNAFDFYLEHIYLPSTMKEVASDFYYEAGIDTPNHPPYVRIHPDNPVFYAKDGTLYFRANDQCALDSEYKGQREWQP